MTRAIALTVCLLACTCILPAQKSWLTVTVTSGDGEVPLSGVYVLLRFPTRGGRISGVTVASGTAGPFEVPTGPVEVIATCPYGGTCLTKVLDIFVGPGNTTASLAVALRPEADVWHGRAAANQTIHLLSADGRPASRVQFMVRDALAENLTHYSTDSQGEATVNNPGKGAILVAFLAHSLASFRLPECRPASCPAATFTLPPDAI